MDWATLWWHVLLLPLYQLAWTAVHELSHAVAAAARGIEVTQIRIWPGIRNGWLYWGWVTLGEGAERAGRGVYLAPYVTDLVVAALGCYAVPWAALKAGPHGWAVAIGLCWIAPGIDLAYNLMKWLIFKRGDFAMAGEADE